MSDALTGKEFKSQLREGRPKMGLFVNSSSPTVAEQLAHSGYDWLLVDTQHGPMGNETLSGMLCGLELGGAMQVETADCIKNIDEIAAVKGVDILFLGQNDLCMSMGLYEKYKFPDMYTSPELNDATNKLVAAAKKNNLICGVFLFGSSRVGEFLERGFPFQSLGNDLHHVLTQSGAYVNDMEKVSKEKGKPWTRRATAFF